MFKLQNGIASIIKYISEKQLLT